MLSSVLFDIILCERDLDTHFEVENRLLVPVVKAAERNCKVAKRVATESSKAVAVLGEREKEIIHYIAKGMTNKQIADVLCLSSHTVATHRRNICAKLDIHSASGLTLYAIVHGLIDLSEISF
jgi:regulator of cell morphogenesis and NO signaling